MTGSHDPRRLRAAGSSPGVAAISHHSAGYVHGLLDPEPTLIHVLALRGAHPMPAPGVIPHHTRALGRHEVTWVEPATDGDPSPLARRSRIPVTAPAATVIMLAAYLDACELAEAVERALQHHCTLRELWSAAMLRRRRGRCGPARVLDMLDQLHPSAEPRPSAERPPSGRAALG